MYVDVDSVSLGKAYRGEISGSHGWHMRNLEIVELFLKCSFKVEFEISVFYIEDY